MRNNIQMMKKSQGFTLLELMITLVIFAILGTLSYNPLLSIYQAQKNQSYVTEIMNQLRATRQQAIAQNQAVSITFSIITTGTQKTLSVSQTPSAPWPTQINSASPIALKLDDVSTNSLILNISSRGDWLDASNVPIKKLTLTHGIYGMRIVKGSIQKCQTSDNPPNIVLCDEVT